MQRKNHLATKERVLIPEKTKKNEGKKRRMVLEKKRQEYMFWGEGQIKWKKVHRFTRGNDSTGKGEGKGGERTFKKREKQETSR